MKNTKPKYSILNNVIYLFKAILNEYPILLIMILAEILLSVIVPIISIYFPSLAVALVTEKADFEDLLIKLGGIGLLMALSQGIKQMVSVGKYYMHNGMRAYFQRKLFFHSLHCDYVHAESKQGQNKYQRAMDSLLCGDGSGTSRMQVSITKFIASSFCFIIYSGIIASLHPLIVVVLILMSILNLFLLQQAHNYEYSRKNETTDISHKMDYVEYTARNTHYGKDIRLYNMKNWFLDMRSRLTEESYNLQNQIKNRFFAVSCINNITLLVRDGIAYGYLIYSVISGKIAIDEFVLYFGAVTGFSGYVQTLSNHFNQLKYSNLQMNDMRAFLDTTLAPEPENPANLSDIRNMSIDFDHVWFSYDIEAEPVLKDLCIHIDAGEKVALVGVNGAGKTTLIKLLCGLYTPDKGQIRIGGIDICRFKREDLFELFSAVFQDLYISPHTVAENISMAPENDTDKEKVEYCLKKAGLWDVIKSYPDSIRTYMDKSVHDGIVLSGGQQQKLLMARALYKDAPFMFLDEPTAALDPIAENETYENFHKLTDNQTVIYISHRLASTRFCDKIFFLKNGQITETGSHKELMQKAGDYAEMFEVQSHYYKKGGQVIENI